MTAVDQSGSKVARYRFPGSWWKSIEIAVHPRQQVSDEVALVLAVSAPRFRDYFRKQGGGGG